MKLRYRVSDLWGDDLNPLRMPNEGDAGIDLPTPRPVTIGAGVTAVDVGLALELPAGYFGRIEGRSSLAARGVFPIGGIIDNGYRGFIKVVLVNVGEPFMVVRGDRIAQLVLYPYTAVNPIRVQVLSETRRGVNGFGSTGK